MGQMLDSRGKGAHAQGCKDFKSDPGRSGTFDCTVVGEREREREREREECVVVRTVLPESPRTMGGPMGRGA